MHSPQGCRCCQKGDFFVSPAFADEPVVDTAGRNLYKSIATESSAALAAEEVRAGPSGFLLAAAFFAYAVDFLSDQFYIGSVIVEIDGREVGYSGSFRRHVLPADGYELDPFPHGADAPERRSKVVAVGNYDRDVHNAGKGGIVHEICRERHFDPRTSRRARIFISDIDFVDAGVESARTFQKVVERVLLRRVESGTSRRDCSVVKRFD